MAKKKAEGWKTNTGSILIAIGTAAFAGAQAAPEKWASWLNLIGVLAGGAGASLAGYGIGTKVEAVKKAAAEKRL